MNVYKNLSIITVVLFLLGVLITVIYLFNLPGQISSALPSANTNWDSVSWIFYNAYIIIGVELALGVASILFLFLANQHDDKVNIVYVDKYSSNREKEEEETEQRTDVQDYKEEVDRNINSVREILASKRDLKTDLDKALSFICNKVEACQGAIFLKHEKDGKRVIRLVSSYAYSLAETAVLEYEFGEGLTGQAAKEGKLVKIDAVPDGYIKIFSGLGSSSPSKLIFVPVKNEDESVGVMEIASFKPFSPADEEFLRQLSPVISEYVGAREAVTESNLDI